jgi:hypothetical protein
VDDQNPWAEAGFDVIVGDETFQFRIPVLVGDGSGFNFGKCRCKQREERGKETKFHGGIRLAVFAFAANHCEKIERRGDIDGLNHAGILL